MTRTLQLLQRNLRSFREDVFTKTQTWMPALATDAFGLSGMDSISTFSGPLERLILFIKYFAGRLSFSFPFLTRVFTKDFFNDISKLSHLINDDSHLSD